MSKIFSRLISTPISIISSFRSFRLISLLFFSLLVVISCGDTTSSGTGYGDTTCSKTFSPTDRATLSANIAALYAQCGGNSASYNNIDVSGVTDMSGLFKGNTNFNGDISGWDMRGVTNVNSMFEGATNFNQDLSGWVLKAGAVVNDSTTPTKMFYLSGMRPKMLPTMNFYQYTPVDKADLEIYIATIFTAQINNEPDLSIIDTSKVTNMSRLFKDKTAFNGYITTWDTSMVKTMAFMFDGASAFNQPIGGWDTRKVTNMESMFKSAKAFNQPIGDWKTGEVTVMRSMFASTSAFNQPIGDWDTRKVQNFTYIFSLSTAFNQDIKGWSNAAVTDTSLRDLMFDGATAMKEINKADWMK